MEIHTIALISHASKVLLKILQTGLKQHVNWELPDVQTVFRKGRGTRDQIAKSIGSSKKQESSRKTCTSGLVTTPKPLIVWITANCRKFWKRLDYQTTWSAFFPGGSDSKASVYNAGDRGSIPGSGRSPGEGNGNPLQYYCLENPMDRGAW